MERTLSGKVRKWTAMGRPLRLVSARCYNCSPERPEAANATLVTKMARTSCLLPASSCPGTSCPPLSSTLPSLTLHWFRPAGTRSAVSSHPMICFSVFLHYLSAPSAYVWCCGSEEGPAAGVGLLVEPPRCRALFVWPKDHPASQPTRFVHLQDAADDASTTTTIDCTYRPFLSLRRAIVAVARSRSSAGGLALGRALHFHLYRDRVVFPSQLLDVSRRIEIVAAVQ